MDITLTQDGYRVYVSSGSVLFLKFVDFKNIQKKNKVPQYLNDNSR